jgi:hypothetical protein
MRALILLSLVIASCGPAIDVATTTSPVTEATATTAVTTTTKGQPAPATPTNTESDHQALYLVSVTASLPDGLSEGLGSVEGVDAITTASVSTLNLVQSIDANGAMVDDVATGFAIPQSRRCLRTLDTAK